MNYFFPSLFTEVNFKKVEIDSELFYCNSGETAIYLLLKSFKLKKGSLVAIPAFVCDTVKTAIYDAELIPFYLDLVGTTSFWSNYDLSLISQNEIKVIILAHLFGEVHPQNKIVMEYCSNRDVKLIQDACQSYGVDESQLSMGDIVYSFGPGKSSTAAKGGAIKFRNNKKIYFNLPQSSLLSQIRSKIFFKMRIFGNEINYLEKGLWQILSRIEKKTVEGMTAFQVHAANFAMSNVKNIELVRKQKFNILREYVEKCEKITILNNFEKGILYKMVLLVDDGNTFTNFLISNSIPHYRIGPDLKLDKEKYVELNNFMNISDNIFQICTESVLSNTEMKRIGKVLMTY